MADFTTVALLIMTF